MHFVGNSFLVGGNADALESVFAALKVNGIRTESNPDLFVKVYSHFGVEDAREIRDRAQLVATSGSRVFVIVTPVMTTEAQNALLKTLEDAPGGARFVFVVPNPDGLLSTVRSRSQIWRVQKATHQSPIDERAFLRSVPKDRLEMLKPLLEKNDDDKRDTAAILSFLGALEQALSQSRTDIPGAEALYRARMYLGDKGSLMKPLLEQVALLVPVHKA